jgi:hypothetical protein
LALCVGFCPLPIASLREIRFVRTFPGHPYIEKTPAYTNRIKYNVKDIEKPVLSVAEASELLGVSLNLAYRLVRQGKSQALGLEEKG